MFQSLNQKEITPLRPSPEVEEKISQKLIKFIEQLIFSKVEKVFDFQVENAKKTALQKALETGDVYYSGGEFYGKFNSQISKELRSAGAKKSGKTFKLEKSKVPDEYISSISKAEQKFESDINKMDKMLKDALSQIDSKKINVESLVNDAIMELDSEATKKMKGIGIKADLDLVQFDNIVKTYTNNYERYIKDFSREEIESMRSEIQEFYFSGMRSKSLVKYIQERKSVSLNRAKFIASQETQLMAASYQREKFKSGGSKRYRWKCVAGSANHPVRPDHKRLNNQIFEWDNPPITNLSTGARNNPSEDFRCRCMAIPIFD